MTRIISPREDVKLLVVSVPKDAYDIEIVDGLSGGKALYWKRKSYRYAGYVDLPPGDYIPLGIATELPEEVTRDLVEEVEDVPFNYDTDEYDSFIDHDESWHSFLRREGITERVFVLRVK